MSFNCYRTSKLVKSRTSSLSLFLSLLPCHFFVAAHTSLDFTTILAYCHCLPCSTRANRHDIMNVLFAEIVDILCNCLCFPWSLPMNFEHFIYSTVYFRIVHAYQLLVVECLVIFYMEPKSTSRKAIRCSHHRLWFVAHLALKTMSSTRLSQWKKYVPSRMTVITDTNERVHYLWAQWDTCFSETTPFGASVLRYL